MNLGMGEYLLYSVMGILVVFFALVLLMIIVKIIGALPQKDMAALAPSNAKGANDGALASPSSLPATEPRKAPGTAGELKLYDTDPRDAAMIMAIVADELGKPLNELRFISIREVK